MIPITRIDEYLAVISQDEDATGLPDQAVTRIDTYLSKIAGEAVAELPEPVTRIDRYLASIAGMDVVMDDPVTRIDYYLATVAGAYSGELPEPVTRIDYYLYNWANGGGMPDWQTFTGNPLTFNAPKAHTLKSVKVEFSPIQSGSGDPSPDNVRPISGRTGATVWRTGENLFDADNVIPSMRIDANTIGSHSTYNLFVVPVAKNTQYTFNQTEHNNGYPVFALSNKYPENGDTVYNQASLRSVNTYTFNSGEYTYALFALYKSAGDEFSVAQGSEAIAINTPYHGSSLPLTWTEQGTVYGGYVTVAEDGSCDLVADRIMETFTGDSSSVSWNASKYARLALSSSADTSKYTQNISNEYICSNSGNDGTLQLATATVARAWDNRFTDSATMKALLNVTPLQFCYFLASPVTMHLSSVTQLTALVGINTMWTDGDSLTVEARGESVQLNALQSLNMLLGGRYTNNHTPDDLTDEEALSILMGGER